MTERVLAVIPIRGADSEFRDNAQPMLAGRPLLDYTFEAIRKAKRIDRVVVSTDSEHVAKASRELGMDVPFLRPPDVANAGVLEALRHAVDWLAQQQGYSPQWVLKAEITHPFRPDGLLDQLIETAVANDLDSAFFAAEENAAHWYLDEEGRPRPFEDDERPRTERRQLYREISGLGTVTRVDNLKAGQLYGPNVGLVPCRTWHSLIDTHDGAGTNYRERLGYHVAEQMAPIFLSGKG